MSSAFGAFPARRPDATSPMRDCASADGFASKAQRPHSSPAVVTRACGRARGGREAREGVRAGAARSVNTQD
eukprot:6178677-Pleurochrysis_carterae.AAC.1